MVHHSVCNAVTERVWRELLRLSALRLFLYGRTSAVSATLWRMSGTACALILSAEGGGGVRFPLRWGCSLCSLHPTKVPSTLLRPQGSLHSFYHDFHQQVGYIGYTDLPRRNLLGEAETLVAVLYSFVCPHRRCVPDIYVRVSYLYLVALSTYTLWDILPTQSTKA